MFYILLHLLFLSYIYIYVHIGRSRIMTHTYHILIYLKTTCKHHETFSMVKMCNIYFILWDFISFMGFYFIYGILLLKTSVYIYPEQGQSPNHSNIIIPEKCNNHSLKSSNKQYILKLPQLSPKCPYFKSPGFNQGSTTAFRFDVL